MISAFVCSLVMFMVPFVTWRMIDATLTDIKVAQRQRRHLPAYVTHQRLTSAIAFLLLPLVLSLFVVGGTAALCGVIAWTVGIVFWFFKH